MKMYFRILWAAVVIIFGGKNQGREADEDIET